ncbi:hypothetical protein [Streptomyces halobius]|uniref:hypothetical protein n=1 Tax=Streptomyces halobius TaxID=2879846 RepID=UPI00387386A2
MRETLEALPHNLPVELDLSEVRHLDHACRITLESWAQQRGTTSGRLRKSSTQAPSTVTPRPMPGEGQRPRHAGAPQVKRGG